jgi:putative nucleotidyltransferase with HDIG domain
MISITFLRDYLRKTIFSRMGRQVFIYLGFFLLVIFIISSNFMGAQVDLKPGQISPRNIRSPHTAIITDEARTKELQEKAAQQVRKVYREDREALAEAEQDVSDFLAQVNGIKQNEALTRAEKINQLQVLVSGIIDTYDLEGYKSSELAAYLADAGEDDMVSVKEGTLLTLNRLMSQPITEEALPTVAAQVKERAEMLSYLPQARNVVEVMTIMALRPNLIYDAAATDEAIEEAVKQVLPVQRTIQQGQMIIREGDPVTQEHIDILKQLGVQRSASLGVTLGGVAMFVAMIFMLSIAYLRMYHRDILKQGRLMMLLGLIFVLIVAIAKGIMVLQIGDRPEINALVGYLIPVSAGSMLVAILLNPQVAYLFTFVAAVFVGMLSQGTPVPFVANAFVSGAVGVLWVSRLNQTGDLARSGLYIAGVNTLTIITMSMLYTGMTGTMILTGVFFGILNGFLSAILTIGLLPYLETVFSVTSMVKLLELSNPNQELLRKLLVEAPGTYHHSIMVGNLAESAAERIGAHPLTVRVGAYYHDIGKLKRPYFFVENQLASDNPHEKIAPSLSALIITSHIKDGVEMAREKRLPPQIIDFIEQHHGDSLVKYFYSRALEEDKEGNVNQETFRYEGPKPQSKEVALVMLADSVEAAVRSLQDPTQGRIEGMVRRIIKERLNDGQLDECDLTFRDLNIIAESFSKVLTGVYHSRIEYPETLAREFEGGEG